MEEMIERLAQDHENARLFAERIKSIDGLGVDLESVETNMVYIDHTVSGLTTEEVVVRMREAGVLVSGRPHRQIRVVINRHHDPGVIEEATERMRGIFEGQRKNGTKKKI